MSIFFDSAFEMSVLRLLVLFLIVVLKCELSFASFTISDFTAFSRAGILRECLFYI